MKKLYPALFLLLLLFGASVTQAEDLITSSDFDSYTIGNLNGQDNWLLTKQDNSTLGEVSITASSTNANEKFAEIINTKSLLITRSSSPKDAGVLQFKIRHNKVGLLYLYAQTSDNGGQLLFSIQFTESNGILIEESDKLTTLLAEYIPDQWYLFTIDFDKARGKNGAFIVSIDGKEYGEYGYVNSESDLFDLAQITLGSESDGEMSISAFADYTAPALSSATSTTSEALSQLSINLSSTSISSNLDNGLIVTASLDGIASIATSSVFEIVATSTSLEANDNSLVGSFIAEIIESVIEIFTPEETTPTNPDPIETAPEIPTAMTSPEESPSEDEVPDLVPEEEIIPETIQDPEPTTVEDVPNNEIITTEF